MTSLLFLFMSCCFYHLQLQSHPQTTSPSSSSNSISSSSSPSPSPSSSPSSFPSFLLKHIQSLISSQLFIFFTDIWYINNFNSYDLDLHKAFDELLQLFVFWSEMWTKHRNNLNKWWLYLFYYCIIYNFWLLLLYFFCIIYNFWLLLLYYLLFDY